ncbi:phage BR0599 family protein, partial [Rhodoplanes serenus]
CGVDRSGAAFQASGSVATLAGTSTFRADGLGDFADGWFTAGRLAFTSGANTGLASEVKLHAVDAVGVGVTLWQAMPEPIAP